MKIQWILASLTLFGALSMAVFVYLFISRNAPGLVHLEVIVVTGVAFSVVCLACALDLFVALIRAGKNESRSPGMAWRVLLVLLCALLVYLFLEAAVTDYYQPLSLYNDVIAALAAWWGLVIVVGMAVVFSRKTGSDRVMRAVVLTIVCALAAWPMTMVLEWVNTPRASPQLSLNQHVFVGGKDGYDTYRIPGMVVIPRGAQLANGSRLAMDRLVAFAEARRDAALDNGVIDLVIKISEDGGANWSSQAVICQNLQQGRRGKCGNPTPVFDSANGTLILAFNMSGTGRTGPKHGGYLMQSDDGGWNWGQPRPVTRDNFVFGPGKGLRKVRAPYAGRLLLPGYVNGVAAAIYSDDGGANWSRGGGVAGADESDLAELPDGRLYLATRHPAPVSSPPEPNGRQFSLSTDGGVSWSLPEVDKDLATPVCQATVLSYGDGLLFANPAHHRARVAMTLRYSPDRGGKWFPGVVVYPGPSGYSVLATGSGGDVFLLYENGDMAYSDRISLARIPADIFLPD